MGGRNTRSENYANSRRHLPPSVTLGAGLHATGASSARRALTKLTSLLHANAFVSEDV